MGQKVTIGGDRIGSGKKMKAELHNYFRSTHNLSEDWASSMASGVLYPCLVKLGLRGDSFDIKLAADARTIPTKGPLFGSFKMQLDVYQCPIRLYQGILHNNPLAIGLKMNQVKFPMLNIQTKSHIGEWDAGKFNDSCLLKYLGLSGIGQSERLDGDYTIQRNINALPALMYYDIFKNYYANKQEEKAYVITADGSTKKFGTYGTVKMLDMRLQEESEFNLNEDVLVMPEQGQQLLLTFKMTNINDVMTNFEDHTETYFDGLISILMNGETLNYSLYEFKRNNFTIDTGDYKLQFTTWDEENEIYQITYTDYHGYEVSLKILDNSTTDRIYEKLAIVDFDLANIDDMRYELLSSNRLGTTYEISNNENTKQPYLSLVQQDYDHVTYNKYPMNGLVLKTYQNDIFNNWLNTEWVEGENGIKELTKVEVTDGAFSMDALNFAQKLYNMLNRVAVAGGTYEEWQDVVYEETNRRQIESPIFVGGLSQEIVFDEIVQTAPTGEGENYEALGTLGGRGSVNERTRKGGNIHVKCEEACFIIGIISLTPRQYNTQGNEFYMTEIQTMDDLHKPALDGIGFQDLIGERMAYWDTKIDGEGTIRHRSKIGKLPAWIDYMTSINRAYGDFAAEGGKGFMILNRNYEYDEETGGIKDATTYIDPSKYNYAFAYTELEAQNFWVKVHFDIEARRLMSARIIPNV